MKRILTISIMMIFMLTSLFAFTCDAASTFKTTNKVTGVSAASSSSTSVTVKWKKYSNAKGYKVYRATSKNGTYKLVKTTTSRSYKSTGLTTEKTYYFKVKAYGKVKGKTKYSKYSSKVSAYPKSIIRTKTPSSYSISQNGILTWNKVSYAGGYQIYYSTTEDGTYSLLDSTTSTSYELTNKETQYWYKVRAYKKYTARTVYSYFTNPIHYPPTDISECIPVLRCIDTDHLSAQLVWDAVEFAGSYEIYKSDSENGTYSRIATVTTLSYNVTKTTSKQYFKIRAVQNNDPDKIYSMYSNVKKIYEKETPRIPIKQ